MDFFDGRVAGHIAHNDPTSQQGQGDSGDEQLGLQTEAEKPPRWQLSIWGPEKVPHHHLEEQVGEGPQRVEKEVDHFGLCISQDILHFSGCT